MRDSTPSPASGVDTHDPTSAATPGQTFPRRVTGTDVLLTFPAVVLVPVAVGVLVVVIGARSGHTELSGAALPLSIMVACVGIWTALLRRGWAWGDLGFVRARRSLWHLLWEVPLLWGAALILTVSIATLSGTGPSGTDSSTSSTTDALQLGIPTVLITAVCVTVLFPALEEILFRRVIFGWLEQRLGVTAAIVGSALAFGLAHIVPYVMLLQVLIGLAAAILVRAHRTLWASLALHGLNNAIATLATLVLLL